MKQFHLYKIKEIYLYVLQVTNDKNKNGIDILAIREDIPYVIFPMYSPTFKKYEDLGIPSITMLKNISPYFLACIQVSQIICGNLFSMSTHNLKEYVREYIIHMNLVIGQSPDIDLLTMTINRSRSLSMEELRKYVTDRIYNSNIDTACKENQ